LTTQHLGQCNYESGLVGRFYRININISDITKLGVVIPIKQGAEPLVTFPLVLPMGWSNSLPIFSTATESIVHLASQHIQDQIIPTPDPLDDRAEQVVPEDPSKLLGSVAPPDLHSSLVSRIQAKQQGGVPIFCCVSAT